MNPTPSAETPLIQVLLATYNGARFLREQIDSVLAQSYPAVELLLRDDGSRDGTQAILEEYAANHPGRIRVLPNDGSTGHAKTNFLRLLQASTAPYVAFCDQDDEWLPNKLELEMAAMRGLEAEHGTQTPLLVFTDLRVVDEHLKTIAESFWKHQLLAEETIDHFERILAQNVVTGCTELMNDALRSLVLRMPEEAHMHDWWSALCVSSMGHAALVRQPTVQYRQHENNVLGALRNKPVTGIPIWRNHGKRKERWEMSLHQAEAMLRVYPHELPSAAVRKLKAMLRCEQSPNRFVRVFTFVTNRFFAKGYRGNFATAWYLWDLDEARRQQKN
ncbi:MAG: glycosyltransferase family 2 protein [Acidobacteriaceae bacterium]|nr:glycosyltransferase family 2 protein [Acidobacteriaceae bacterium]